MNKLSQFKANGMARNIGAAVLLIALTSAPTFAQDPFSSAAQGASNTTTNVVRILASVAFAWFGIRLMLDHEHNQMGKFMGIVSGGIIALFAQPITTWIQSL